MLNTFFDWFREYDDVASVDDPRFTFEARKDDVRATLESIWGVREGEGNVEILELTGVGNEKGFIAVFLSGMSICQYPFNVPRVVKMQASPKVSMNSYILGRGQGALTVILLSFRYAVKTLVVYLFSVRTTRARHIRSWTVR